MHPVLGGVVVERQQLVHVVGDLRGGLGELGAVAPLEAFTAARACCLSSAFQISASAFFSPGCADFSSAASTLADLVEPTAALPGLRGTPPAARSRTAAPRPRPPAPGRASRGGRSRAAGQPTTPPTPASLSEGDRAPCGRRRALRSSPAGTASALPAGCSHGCHPPRGTRVHAGLVPGDAGRCSAFHASVSLVTTSADSRAHQPRSWPSAGTHPACPAVRNSSGRASASCWICRRPRPVRSPRKHQPLPAAQEDTPAVGQR